MLIPFNRPYMTGRELSRIAEAHHHGQLAGNGPFTVRCQEWLKSKVGCHSALLTHSCTAALEMAATLVEARPGDEVIVPSFTFVSTANAFVARGATPVFVDIRPDTLTLNESLVADAITSKTKAIVPVHYAGVGCEMAEYAGIADEKGIFVIEDAAQAIMSTHYGRPLGGIGHLGAFSFHETKNISSGEGGALVVNDERLVERAEIIWEKGTNRSRFNRGVVDKYTWVDHGSSYLPGEIVAAFLSAQIEEAETINSRRLAIWNRYHEAFSDPEASGRVRRPVTPEHCVHNAHMYYLLLPSESARDAFIVNMRDLGIVTVFHYVPLHSSPAGERFGRAFGALDVTDDIAGRLVRLPLWIGLEPHLARVISAALDSITATC